MSKLAADLVAALDDEQIYDMTLQGNDGGKVPAFRFLLSARSKVFQKMLCGNFKESDTSNIPLDYSSATIQRIVHYCCTDEVMEPLEGCSEEKVRAMVCLRCAANYFELKDLEDKIITIISKHITQFPSLACAVLDESSAKGDEGLSGIAMGIIGLGAEDALLPTETSHEGGVLALSTSVLKSVLTSQVVAADHFLKYRLLQRWCDEIAPDGSQDISCQEQEERSAVAKELAKSINFHLIQPFDLAGMTGSNLVTKDQLYDALKAHALSAGPSARTQVTTGPSVHATGASVPEVNGKYVEAGKCDGVMSYTKRGIWQGVRGNFRLYRSGHWRFHFRNHNTQQEIKFYRSNHAATLVMDAFPRCTWVNYSQDRRLRAEPALRVLFVQR